MTRAMQLACVIRRRNNPPLAVVSRGFCRNSGEDSLQTLKPIANHACEQELNEPRHILLL
jgi:hypothetical protein